jgi:hypothetical protein
MAGTEQGKAPSKAGRGRTAAAGTRAKAAPAKPATRAKSAAPKAAAGAKAAPAKPAKAGAPKPATRAKAAPAKPTTRAKAARPATATATPAAASPAAAESRRQHRSAVEALLASHPGDSPAPARTSRTEPAPPIAPATPTPELAGATRALLSSALLVPGEHVDQPAQPARHAAPGEPVADVVRLDPRTGLPPAQDVALGVASIAAERLWRAGAAAIAWGNSALARSVGVARALSPQVATMQADARLQRLAARGQQVRLERSEALTTSLTAGIMAAATSDAVREMVVAAIEEATDDVLDVVLPAMLEAITERETQDKLDELMAGLLLRQLPAALERTIPQVMLRTATRPAAGLMPFLGGVLPR